MLLCFSITTTVTLQLLTAGMPYPVIRWRLDGAAGGFDGKYPVAAARQNPHVFTLDPSGAYKAEVEELPGDVLTYYFMQSNPTEANTDYTVAYYYTTADSLDGATASNTWRVESYDFDRVFA